METQNTTKSGGNFRSRFRFFMLAILVLSIMMTGALLGCGGNDNPGGDPHTCESVCPICDGCLDAECDDPACAIKCEGHGNEKTNPNDGVVCPICDGCLDPECEEDDKCGHDKTAYVYEAENAVIVNGTAAHKPWNLFTNEGRTYIENLNRNAGATVTFTVDAPRAVTVSLGITITRRDIDTVFTDKMGVSVNDGMDLESPVTIPAYVPGAEQWRIGSFADFVLGCIDLDAGTNTIRFTVNTTGDYGSYNFDKITLYSDAVLSTEHVCESKCTICGKCKNEDCEEAACLEKCECDGSVILIEAETAVLAAGEVRAPRTYAGGTGTVVERLNGNRGASMTLTFDMPAAATMELWVNINRRNIETTFTDLMGVSVNGGANLVSETVIPAYTGTDGEWKVDAYGDFYICDIELVQGTNTISFTSLLDVTDYSGYNFDYIKLITLGYVAPHVCESECPTCGGCLDADCEEDACLVKCDCVDGLPMKIEAETATLVAGAIRSPRTNTGGTGTVVERLNYNQGASMTLTFEMPAAGTVELWVNINRRAVETVFTNLMGLSVNGGVYIVSEAVIPAYTDAGEWTVGAYGDFYICDIDLDQGTNTISFTSLLDVTDYSGYNFDFITLRSLGA